VEIIYSNKITKNVDVFLTDSIKHYFIIHFKTNNLSRQWRFIHLLLTEGDAVGIDMWHIDLDLQDQKWFMSVTFII
jgi:hypothetical protein